MGTLTPLRGTTREKLRLIRRRAIQSDNFITGREARPKICP